MKTGLYIWRASMLCLTLLFFAENGFADTPFQCRTQEPKESWGSVVQKIEQAYQFISSFEAGFRQESYLIGLDSRDFSSGTIYFKKPGKMNWTYSIPEHQQFVADGEMAWFYQPQQQQVTLTDYSDAFSSDTPVTFLLGLSRLEDSFNTVGVCKTASGLKVEFAPKRIDGTLEKLHLLVDSASFEPRGAQIDNVGGNETSIVFEDTIANKEVKAERFSFSIPRGVDIIDNRRRSRR